MEKNTAHLVLNEFLVPNPACLFLDKKFFDLHNDNSRGLYCEYVEQNDTVAAAMHATPVTDTIWRNPRRGTYGGLFVEDSLSVQKINNFVEEVETALKAEGCRTFEWILPPAAHNEERFSKLLYVLQGAGYTAAQNELNFSRAVSKDIAFESGLSRGNQRCLKALLDREYTWHMHNHAELPALYDVIKNNRAERGFEISMTCAQIQTMIDLFPDRYHLFSIQKDKQIAAAAICIQLEPHVLYVFYWGHLKTYQKDSPVVLLAKAIYSFCQEHSSITLMDVGTSTENGQPNAGLIQFKKSLGFTPSVKLKMVKEL